MAINQNFPRSAAPTGALSFTNLDLTTPGSYKAAGVDFDSDTPGWAADASGVVHLRGVIESLNVDYHGDWAVTPVAIRPTHQKFLLTWARFTDSTVLYTMVIYVNSSNMGTMFGAQGDFFIPDRAHAAGLLIGLDGLSFTL